MDFIHSRRCVWKVNERTANTVFLIHPAYHSIIHEFTIWIWTVNTEIAHADWMESIWQTRSFLFRTVCLSPDILQVLFMLSYSLLNHPILLQYITYEVRCRCRRRCLRMDNLIGLRFHAMEAIQLWRAPSNINREHVQCTRNRFTRTFFYEIETLNGIECVFMRNNDNIICRRSWNIT